MSQEHVTLDTVDVQITPLNALAVMQRINERQEAWSLVNTKSHLRAMDFELDIEGSTGMVAIRLNADGTWTASSHIVVGEKSNG